MITLQKADQSHIKGIQRVCSAGWRTTYQDIHDTDYIDQVIEEYYNLKRLEKEVTVHNHSWTGYYVALENGEVIGAAGGGLIADTVGELFVLYLDPARRGEGIGSRLLEAVTTELVGLGAKEQWVSVTSGNQKGIPFYEAKEFALDGPHPDKVNSLRYYRKL
ncbi:GNAT family N-acetyltransferase [Streptococcus rifensis]